jgi:3-methyladenine DNA glycosylase AlkD
MHEIFPSAPSDNREIAAIKRSLFLRMNGETSAQMKKNGVFYRRNYGVAIPEIRLLADALPHTAELAEGLWNEKIRETMLLATLLYPPESFTAEKADAWIEAIDNMELVEQLSRNLLAKAAFADPEVIRWANSFNPWRCATGFYAAALFRGTLDTATQLRLEQLAMDCPLRDLLPVNRAIALFFRKTGAKHTDEAARILSLVRKFEKSDNQAERYIYEEVNTDLTYRFGLNE